MAPTIYIIYNANASLVGKLGYACRKITAPSDRSPCPACDLTHGGLRLTETKEWTATKQRIDADVQQRHLDEIDQEMADFARKNGLTFPVVLGRNNGDGKLELLMSAKDLRGCNKDHSAFLTMLQTKAAERNIALNVK